MRRTLLAVIMLVLSPTAALAEAAIAHGKTADGSDTFLTATNQSTAKAAEASALGRCERMATDCSIELQFHAQCYALAYGHRGGWAHGTGIKPVDAKQAALVKCTESGEVCDVVKTFCDTVSQKAAADQTLTQISPDTLAQCKSGDDEACLSGLNSAGISERDRTVIAEQRARIAQDRLTQQQALAELAQQKTAAEKTNDDLKAQMARLIEAQKFLAEKQQKDAQLDFSRNLAGCKSYDLDACDRALGYAKVTDTNRFEIAGPRNMRIAYLENRKLCDGGSSAACGLALASPAVLKGERADLQQMYEQASVVACARR